MNSPDTATPRPSTLSGDESLELPEFDTPPPDPVELARRWLRLADDHQVREPLAVTLSTADDHGRPSARTVLLKEIADDGFVFTTHTGSRKGRDLAINPFAAITFYWRETLQQITVTGAAAPLAAHRSDALFAERPVPAQVTTAVSVQSAPLHDETELHTRARHLIDAGEPLPRPPEWGGYLLVPDAIEFWQGRASRLHRRLVYRRDARRWTHQRLQP